MLMSALFTLNYLSPNVSSVSLSVFKLVKCLMPSPISPVT